MEELNKKLDRIIFLLETTNAKKVKETRVNILPAAPAAPGVPRVRVGRFRGMRPLMR